MKEARNHNVYLDKSKQKPNDDIRERNRSINGRLAEMAKQNNDKNEKTKIEEQFQSITNLSMITAKEEILII
jgi:hypothetical protein